MLRNLYIAIFFTIPLLAIAMLPMIGVQMPLFINHKTSPVTFALIQILLLLPVMYIGRNFYTKGFKALFKRIPNMDSLIAVGTSAAIFYSLFATVMILLGNHEYAMDLYYETAAVIITLIKIR